MEVPVLRRSHIGFPFLGSPICPLRLVWSYDTIILFSRVVTAVVTRSYKYACTVVVLFLSTCNTGSVPLFSQKCLILVKYTTSILTIIRQV